MQLELKRTGYRDPTVFDMHGGRYLTKEGYISLSVLIEPAEVAITVKKGKGSQKAAWKSDSILLQMEGTAAEVDNEPHRAMYIYIMLPVQKKVAG